MADRTCKIDGCEKIAWCRGWCVMHYGRWQRHGDPLKLVGRTYVVTPIADRFWPKVDKTSHPNGCWIWMGSKLSAGYGTIWDYDRGQVTVAHRVAYALVNGEIPDSLQIDHLCRNTGCVNPAHLEPVTPRENTVRGYAPSIGASHQLAKTACPQGHPYDESNTYRRPAGGRGCRLCTRLRMRRRRAALRKESL